MTNPSSIVNGVQPNSIPQEGQDPSSKTQEGSLQGTKVLLNTATESLIQEQAATTQQNPHTSTDMGSRKMSFTPSSGKSNVADPDDDSSDTDEVEEEKDKDKKEKLQERAIVKISDVDAAVQEQYNEAMARMRRMKKEAELKDMLIDIFGSEEVPTNAFHSYNCLENFLRNELGFNSIEEAQSRLNEMNDLASRGELSETDLGRRDQMEGILNLMNSLLAEHGDEIDQAYAAIPALNEAIEHSDRPELLHSSSDLASMVLDQFFQMASSEELPLEVLKILQNKFLNDSATPVGNRMEAFRSNLDVVRDALSREIPRLEAKFVGALRRGLDAAHGVNSMQKSLSQMLGRAQTALESS